MPTQMESGAPEPTFKVGAIVETTGFQPPAIGVPGVRGVITEPWDGSELFQWLVRFPPGFSLAMREDEMRPVSAGDVARGEFPK